MSEFPVGGELPLDRYREAMQDMPLATVDIVFVNPDRTKTLLGKRKNEPYAGKFYTFGGRLFKNEELIDAAVRIAKKEVGIVLSPMSLIKAGVLNEINPSSIFSGINYHAVNVFFACTIPEDEISLDDQHTEAKWLSVNDPDVPTYAKSKVVEALKVLKKI